MAPTRLSRSGVLQSAAVSAAAAAAGAFAAPFISRRGPRRNIILVVADALRADRLGLVRTLDGVPGSITPFLDHIAAAGLNFTNAVAPSSWTPISMCSILYDASPLAVGYAPKLRVTTQTAPLAEALAERGHHTASVNANPVMNSEAARRGFASFRGFKERSGRLPWEDHNKPQHRCAREINRITRGLVDGLKLARSYFLYLHFMDNHDPYFCPGRHLRRLGTRYDPYANLGWVRHKFKQGRADAREGLPFEAAVRQLKKQYDASVLYIDESPEEQFAWFESEGLLEDTLVIFTSDHGEEFLDNSEVEPALGHAGNLSQVQLRTPLVVWRPGEKEGFEIPQPVSSRRVINDCVNAFVDGRPPGGLPSDYGREKVLSALNFKDFNGASVVQGSVKVIGNIASEGNLDPASIRAFRIAEGIKVREVEGTARMAGLLKGALEDAVVETWSEEGLACDERDRLRALGYLN